MKLGCVFSPLSPSLLVINVIVFYSNADNIVDKRTNQAKLIGSSEFPKEWMNEDRTSTRWTSTSNLHIYQDPWLPQNASAIFNQMLALWTPSIKKKDEFVCVCGFAHWSHRERLVIWTNSIPQFHQHFNEPTRKPHSQQKDRWDGNWYNIKCVCCKMTARHKRLQLAHTCNDNKALKHKNFDHKFVPLKAHRVGEYRSVKAIRLVKLSGLIHSRWILTNAHTRHTHTQTVDTALHCTALENARLE